MTCKQIRSEPLGQVWPATSRGSCILNLYLKFMGVPDVFGVMPAEGNTIRQGTKENNPYRCWRSWSAGNAPLASPTWRITSPTTLPETPWGCRSESFRFPPEEIEESFDHEFWNGYSRNYGSENSLFPANASGTSEFQRKPARVESSTIHVVLHTDHTGY